eukprot:14115326-Alexandrium_andersonii.AAC.1
MLADVAERLVAEQDAPDEAEEAAAAAARGSGPVAGLSDAAGAQQSAGVVARLAAESAGQLARVGPGDAAWA